ncbi:MAG: SDR family NAD(P)-dependent oxidoreductase, partial [Myxococcales bacterium]|nr:SDR family NAD(P)-dependent oxidoreductase [Myxococcales bacterium]
MTERVLVTGASRGIGRAIAVELAGAGYCVTLAYRRGEAEAAEVEAGITAAGGRASRLAFDVADRDACASVLAADVEAHGAYFGVVSNAGVTADRAFPAMRGEDWDVVLRTNLDGFYNVVQPLV